MDGAQSFKFYKLLFYIPRDICRCLVYTVSDLEK